MTREQFVPEFINFLNEYPRFILSGHVKPDGDSIAAVVTVARQLLKMGKEVWIVADGSVDRYEKYVSGLPFIDPDTAAEKAETPFALIQVDHAEPSRMGAAAFLFEKAEDTLCVDHHVCPKAYAAHHYAEEGQSAASEIIYHLMRLAGFEIDEAMASALYMGISFDTGGFRHSSTTPETYRMAADLIESGADCTAIMNELYHSFSFLEKKIEGKVAQKARLYQDGIVISCMEEKDFRRLGATPNDAEGVVNMLGEIRDAETAVYLREVAPGQIRVNLRSKSATDVAAVARVFGGGGHVRAAGCTIEGPMLYAKTQILKAIRLERKQAEQ